MLPFLKNQAKQTSLSVKYRTPDEKEPFSEDDSSGDEGLHAAAQDIIKAIETKDYKQLALAIKAAFDICDASPHVEGPHLNEEDKG